MEKTIGRSSEAGFTRMELTAVLGVLALFGALAAPMLATTRADSERAGCFNNLRQIGRGVRQWASEHQERVPWLTPLYEGGTQYFPKVGYASEEFYVMSNELVSPRILTCPADSQTVVAPDWETYYFNPFFEDQATSYSLGLHAYSERPRSLMAADRNIRYSSSASSCSVGVNNAKGLAHFDPSVGWQSGIHNNAGHLLLNDGSVLLTDSPAFRRALMDQSSGDNGLMHILSAR